MKKQTVKRVNVFLTQRELNALEEISKKYPEHKTFIIELLSLTSHEQVTIRHNIEVNFIGNQQTMFSVNFATTIHHHFRKGHVTEPLGKSTYSTII